MAEQLKQRLEAAGESFPELRALLLGEAPNDTESIKVKEAALQRLAEALVAQQDAAGLRALLADLRPLFGALPKAKTAKIVRTVIDAIAKIPGSTQLQLEVCREQAAWAAAEKRTFLRQRIELRLAGLLLETRDYPAALATLGRLLSEVKRLDDKLLLVELHLLESKVHHALRNLPKARAALTAARTAANAIYVPPLLQADIDCQSGTLHADERDYKTAYSYYYEAFEQHAALDEARAVSTLKYMLLCKIMAGEVSDVPAIISSKAGLKFAGPDVDAMKAVAAAYDKRSLADFQAVLKAHEPQLAGDPIVHIHLSELYDKLLAQNLIRLIEPFSRVEVAHVASLIALPVAQVEAKLSQMILDKKFAGTLDQGVGTLEIFDEQPPDAVYPAVLDTIGNLGRVVDSLFARSAKLTA